MFTKKFERRVYVFVGVLLMSLMLGTSFGAYILWPSRREAGYEPEQPIPFSHALHAGELRIDCLYCHSQAGKGAQATVPPVSTCMNCHTEVQTKDASGALTPGMATLLEYWEQKRPVRWNKVSDLADFAYFDHSRHIAASLACEECHGPVKTMVRVRRQFGLKMSWCLACHKQKPTNDQVAVDPSLTTRAPINCTTCHR